MSTIRLTLNLPESLKAFVDRQAAEQGLSSAEAYVQKLIQDAERSADGDAIESDPAESDEPLRAWTDRVIAQINSSPAAKDKVEKLLLEALKSESREMTPERWDELCRKARNHWAARQSQ